MLQDPENFEEWEDQVWASNDAEARRKCEFMASETGLTEVINVSQASERKSKKGNYRYICWFRSEVKPHGNSNN